MNRLAEEIKGRVRMEELLFNYGYQPNRNGFLCCPFHEGDRTASLKVYKDGWHCFGCGRGGSVIDFVMELFGICFLEAAKRINEDFHLCLTQEKPSLRQSISAQRDRERRNRERQLFEKEYEAMCVLHRTLWWNFKTYAPQTQEAAEGFTAPLHPLFVEALQNLSWVEGWLENNPWRGRERGDLIGSGADRQINV